MNNTLPAVAAVPVFGGGTVYSVAGLFVAVGLCCWCGAEGARCSPFFMSALSFWVDVADEGLIMSVLIKEIALCE